MSRRATFALVLGLLAWLVAIPLPAKCAMVPHVVDGALLRRGTDEPIGGATVLVFLNRQVHILPDGYDSEYPDFVISGVDGSYAARSYLDPFNGLWLFGLGGHRCDAKLESVEVVVLKKGYFASRRVFRRKQFEIEEQGITPSRVTLPPIELYPAVKREGSAVSEDSDRP